MVFQHDIIVSQYDDPRYQRTTSYRQPEYFIEEKHRLIDDFELSFLDEMVEHFLALSQSPSNDTDIGSTEQFIQDIIFRTEGGAKLPKVITLASPVGRNAKKIGHHLFPWFGQDDYWLNLRHFPADHWSRRTFMGPFGGLLFNHPQERHVMNLVWRWERQIEDGIETGKYWRQNYTSVGLGTSIHNNLAYQAVYWGLYRIVRSIFSSHVDLTPTIVRDVQWLSINRSVSWWIAGRKTALVGLRPKAIHRNAAGLVHRSDGPAIEYHDGTVEYWHEGARLTEDNEWFMASPHKIKAKHISKRMTFKEKMLMIERYGGWERYLRDVDAEHVATDQVGRMWRVDLGSTDNGRFNVLHIVEVLNGTPEPDGSYRKYFLRVPSDCRTPLQGVSWTYGIRSGDYLAQLQVRT